MQESSNKIYKTFVKDINIGIFILNENLDVLLNNYNFPNNIRKRLVKLVNDTSEMMISDNDFSDYDISDVKVRLVYSLSKKITSE